MNSPGWGSCDLRIASDGAAVWLYVYDSGEVVVTLGMHVAEAWTTAADLMKAAAALNEAIDAELAELTDGT